MRAAYEYLDSKYESPGLAANAWNVERQHVNYYVRKLTSAGKQRSETAVSTTLASTSSSQTLNKDYNLYCQAWKHAAELCAKVGRKKAALMTTEKFGVHISASSARRAHRTNGELPARQGRTTYVPKEVERKLEDLCLLLREMNMPVFRFMVLNYVNTLIVKAPRSPRHSRTRRSSVIGIIVGWVGARS